MPDRKKMSYAGIWNCLAALVIDGLLFCAIFLPITRIAEGVWIMSASDHRWANGLFITDPLCLIFLALMFLYFVTLEGLVGATLGKWALGLRVVTNGGDQPGPAWPAVRCETSCAWSTGCLPSISWASS